MLSQPAVYRRLSDAFIGLRFDWEQGNHYLENPHGKWMRSVKDQMIGEEDEIRRRALAGTLLPPGRKPGESAPYVER